MVRVDFNLKTEIFMKESFMKELCMEKVHIIGKTAANILVQIKIYFIGNYKNGEKEGFGIINYKNGIIY